MIATTVGYDVVFVAHVVVALGVVVVTVGLRAAAASVRPGAERAELRRRFPDRTNWAARVLHLLPVTGVALSLMGGRDVSFARAWVGAGVAIYVLLAFWLEARVLPVERSLSRTVHGTGDVDWAIATTLGRRLDGVLVLLVLAVVTMVVQY